MEQKEEINIQPEQNEETTIQKNEERLRNLWDNFKCSNIQVIGLPEGEEEDQEIENLFEQIMKENFPNLAKEIEIQVQEAQRIPNKRNTPRHIKINCQRLKIKNLKSSKRKEERYPTKEFP